MYLYATSIETTIYVHCELVAQLEVGIKYIFFQIRYFQLPIAEPSKPQYIDFSVDKVHFRVQTNTYECFYREKKNNNFDFL